MISVRLLFKYFLFIFLLFLISCSNKPILLDGNTMGTTYSISIHNPKLSKNELEHKIDSVLTNINEHFSTYIENSEISMINNFNHTNEIILSDKFQFVLNEAIIYCELSKGSYDITINHLVDLWGFGKSFNKIFPNKSNIKLALDNTGYDNLTIRGNTLTKNNPLVKLDLNSIAKGYAVDEIYSLLENLGQTDFLVEIGGELRSKGNNYYENWIVGIQNPNNYSIIEKIKLNNFSMATSGTYNNFFKHEGEYYSHIINPITGYPFKYETVSATVLANNCMKADVLATLCMTMNVSDALNIINKDPSVEAYIISINEDGNIIEYKSNKFDDFIIF